MAARPGRSTAWLAVVVLLLSTVSPVTAQQVQATGSTESATKPRAKPQTADRGWPEFSVRLDPLNWLMRGRLSFEFEVAVWRFISAQVSPVFVVWDQAPLIHFKGRPDQLRIGSDGAGPLAGFELGAAFWLMGKPFESYVVRAYFANTAMRYRAEDSSGFSFDEVNHTERRLGLSIGSHSRFGHFTIGGSAGFEFELNQASRCFPADGSRPPSVNAPSSECAGDDANQLLIALDPALNATYNLNGSIHPVYFVLRLTIGAVF